MIVQDAREAVQTAEDARTIAERKHEEEALASARTEAANAKQALTQAQEATRQVQLQADEARTQADDARARADAEHAALMRAEAEARTVRNQAAQAEVSEQPTPEASSIAEAPPKLTGAAPRPDTRKSDLRMALLDQLNGVTAMLDTARGLVATVPDSDFTGPEPHAAVSGRLARIATIVMAHPGLSIDVEGNSDTGAGQGISSERAEAVRRALVARGVPESRVTAHGLGDTHLFGPNTSVAGRAANRRVEIVISGDPIGDLPLWDHPYTLAPTL